MGKSDKDVEFEKVIAAYGQVITKVCYVYASDSDNYKDLYQETLINIWKALDRFRGQSALTTWIYRVAINTCISCYRRSSRHSHTTSLDDLVLADSDATGHSDWEHDECLREMYALINCLPPLDRAIMTMWLDERPYQEIAEVTGLTRTNVASRINRIKQRLVKMSNR